MGVIMGKHTNRLACHLYIHNSIRMEDMYGVIVYLQEIVADFAPKSTLTGPVQPCTDNKEVLRSSLFQLQVNGWFRLGKLPVFERFKTRV